MSSLFKTPSIPAPKAPPPPQAPAGTAPTLAAAQAGQRADVQGNIIKDNVSNSLVIQRAEPLGVSIKPFK